MFKDEVKSHGFKDGMRRWVHDGGTVRLAVCDTETTGITSDAKCTQVSIDVYEIDGDSLASLSRSDGTSRVGQVTEHYDFHVNPLCHIDDGASKVTGITDEMASKWKPFSEYRDVIQAVIDSADVIVGHNVGFDIRRLEHEGIRFSDDVIVSDTMFDYADCCRYRWGEDRPTKTLTCAARRFGYEFDAHDSSNDIEATAVLFGNLLGIGEATGSTVSDVTRQYETHTKRVQAYLKGRETLRKRREMV